MILPPSLSTDSTARIDHQRGIERVFNLPLAHTVQVTIFLIRKVDFASAYRVLKFLTNSRLMGITTAHEATVEHNYLINFDVEI